MAKTYRWKDACELDVDVNDQTLNVRFTVESTAWQDERHAEITSGIDVRAYGDDGMEPISFAALSLETQRILNDAVDAFIRDFAPDEGAPERDWDDVRDDRMFDDAFDYAAF